MYYKYTEEELRALCRTSLESFEIWARRIIHEKMTEHYGDNFIDKQFEDGNYLIKKDIRNHVHSMLTKEPERFKRAVDTLFMEHIEYFLCNPAFYNRAFKDVLKFAYPLGKDEAKDYIKRLVPIRNALSHSGVISIRQAEKAICYSNDFIDGIKQYEKERGQEQVWNVPRIIRITDSLGNVFENPTEVNGCNSIFNVPQKKYCGDSYSVTVEIDSSFSDSEYTIIWIDNNHQIDAYRNCKQYITTFNTSDIGENHYIRCKVISNKEWHKYINYDCEIFLNLTVYPPVE